MPSTEKTILEALKNVFFQKLKSDWDLKWKLPLKAVYPKDFRNINLNLFVTLLANEMNKFVSENTLILDKKSSFIGTQTLRRILENPSSNTSLQLTTKNCIANYLGHSSWDNFVDGFDNLQPTLNDKTDKTLSKKSLSEYYIKNKFRYQKYLPVIGIAILIGVFLMQNYWKINPKKYPKTVPFRLLEATNNGISPTKVSFTFNLNGIDFDSAFINYDGIKTPITQFQDTLSYTSVNPTLQDICIRLDTTEYHFMIPVKSGGWFANFKAGPMLSPEIFKKVGHLHINTYDTPREIYQAGDYYVFYRNIDNFSIDADSMIFETRVKNPQKEGGISCYDVSLNVMGDIGMTPTYMGFNIVHPSCTDYVHLMAGTTDIGYKAKLPKIPLSAFGIDISDWTTIKYIAKNGVLTVFANEKQIYKLPYEGKVGAVKLIQIEFKGSGSVDYVKMSNSHTGQLAYFDGFD